MIGSNPDFFLKQKMASDKSKNLDAIDPRALEHYLAHSAIPRGCTRCARIIAPAPMPISNRQSGSRCWKEDHHPDAGIVGRCRNRTCRGDAAGYLEELGDHVQGAPVDSDHFLNGGESGCDGEDVAEFFLGDRLVRSTQRRCAPSPWGEVGVRGYGLSMSLKPLTRIASGDAIRPLPMER